MSGIKLVPEGGGEAIPVPDDSTVIGRGAFLKVTDKRVSRSHAKLQIIDGKLYLTPTHTNPCFLRRGGKGAQEVLQRDIRQCLENGDVFGLLPDQLFYTVTYSDAPVNGVERNGDAKDNIKSQPLSPSSVKNGENDKQNESVKHDGIKEEEEESEYKEESKEQVRPQIVSVVRADGKDMALPLEKKRILPEWMIKTAKAAQPPTNKTSKNTQATKPQHAATANRRPAMTESRRQQQVTEEEEDEFEEERSIKANKRRKPNSDEDYEDESEDESPRRSRKRSRKYVSDDDDDDDYEEETPKRKRGKKRRKGSSDDDDDYELSRRGKRAGTRAQKHEDDDDEPRGKRPQRAAKQKRGSYVDDFMVGEDFDDSDEPPEKPDTDSDFEVDEEDSGSDWERGRGSQKNKRQASRTPVRRGRKRKSKVDSDEEEEDFDMSDEEYTPRPSRRRGGGTPAKKAAHKRKERDYEDEEEEEEEEMEASPTQGNKPRTPCWYGNKCYRKNPSHFKEFCHPGDDSYEDVSGEDNGDEKQDEKRNKPSSLKGAKLQPAAEVKAKKTKRKSDDEEEDDGLPNTYDYRDSFIDDASQSQRQTLGSVGADEEEDVKCLVKEANSFIANKKMQQNVRDGL